MSSTKFISIFALFLLITGSQFEMTKVEAYNPARPCRTVKDCPSQTCCSCNAHLCVCDCKHPTMNAQILRENKHNP